MSRDRPVLHGRWRPLLLAVGLLVAVLAWGDKRSDTEARLAEISREIEVLQQRLEADRGSLVTERDALRDLDLAIQDTSQALARVAQTLDAQTAEVAGLRKARDAYLEQLGERQDELARQLLAAWTVSRESRLKLLLNQEDPARLGRLLAYHDYFGAAHAERIRELLDALARLADMQNALDTELDALTAIREEQEARQATLATQRDKRLVLVAELEGRLSDGAVRIEELQRNRADLETLLERLGDALADIPADLGNRTHPSELRGQLPMPVPGRVLEAFGQPRAAGLAWQGWLVAADAGTPVRPVAYGRVAYADWLRGYGLLLIVDHGDGFMSLYGHNESLRAEVGDWVDPGEVISTVGVGPERRQGLYFELRRKGKAMDPAAWMRR